MRSHWRGLEFVRNNNKRRTKLDLLWQILNLHTVNINNISQQKHPLHIHPDFGAKIREVRA